MASSVDDLGSARGIPAGLDGVEIKRRVLEAIDQAEVFLSKAPSAWAEGLPVDDAGRPVTEVGSLHEVRTVSLGGMPMPEFPDQAPSFP